MDFSIPDFLVDGRCPLTYVLAVAIRQACLQGVEICDDHCLKILGKALLVYSLWGLRTLSQSLLSAC